MSISKNLAFYHLNACLSSGKVLLMNLLRKTLPPATLQSRGVTLSINSSVLLKSISTYLNQLIGSCKKERYTEFLEMPLWN